MLLNRQIKLMVIGIVDVLFNFYKISQQDNKQNTVKEFKNFF